MGKYDPAPTFAAGLIRSARDLAGLTQSELAARAGVTQQAISAYETGRMDPTLDTLTKLIEAAGLEMRVRLVPRDYHDESLQAFVESLPAAQQAEIEEQRHRRAEAARLRRVRGR
ncbi:MAG: helix-turn-helix transcriptional regulator [bacterium]|nr:helix-turn-helix transcriptional regulator [bacterium]